MEQLALNAKALTMFTMAEFMSLMVNINLNVKVAENFGNTVRLKVNIQNLLSIAFIWCYGIVLMCHNGLQIAEVRKYGEQNFNLTTKL